MTAPLAVLFVCTANICRSPSMQLLTDQLSGGVLRVSSAGTHGYEAREMEDAMVPSLFQRGVPIAAVRGFRSRPLTAELVAEADVVLTATAAHHTFTVDLLPEAGDSVFTLGGFAAAVTSSGGATGRDALDAVRGHARAADPALDLADPFRRGPEAAASCVAQIESLLRVAVPALAGSGRICA